MLTHPSIRIGDRARFPLGRLGDERVYPRSWEAIAFRNGCVVARRLHDGYTREVAIYWWERYTLDERPRARQTERRRLPLPRLNVDRSRPGFYVSARSSDGRQYVLCAGPFSYPGDAARVELRVRRYIAEHYGQQYDRGEIAIGVCRVETGERDGRFNAEIGVSA